MHDLHSDCHSNLHIDPPRTKPSSVHALYHVSPPPFSGFEDFFFLLEGVGDQKEERNALALMPLLNA